MLIDLRLEGKTAVFFGGGRTAERKVRKLVEQGARVTVISKRFTEGLMELGEKREIILVEAVLAETSPVIPEYIGGASIVIAATDSSKINTVLSRAAREEGVLVCAVDMPALSDFYFPAVAQKGSIRVGVCTDGKSPLMSRLLRQRIEKIITEEDVLQVELQAHARKLAQEKIQGWEARREALYRIAGDQEIRRILAEGRLDEAKRIAEKIIET